MFRPAVLCLRTALLPYGSHLFQTFGKIALIGRSRNENEDKTKTQMTESFNQYSENETKIWRQNILNQFNSVFSSCLRSHFVISLISLRRRRNEICCLLELERNVVEEKKNSVDY